MGYRSVRYRKQLEFGGRSGEPVSLDEGIARIKKMAEVKADRTYKNGKRRKDVDQTVELVIVVGNLPMRIYHIRPIPVRIVVITYSRTI